MGIGHSTVLRLAQHAAEGDGPGVVGTRMTRIRQINPDQHKSAATALSAFHLCG